jgi:xylan 1,4-beta-xylosidase
MTIQLKPCRELSSQLLLLIFVVSVSFTTIQAQHANPVIPGDRPDPSVIRVGNTYWATTTSGMWEPAFSLFHSRDLVHWELSGAVLQTPPAWTIGDFWAPEISSYRGRFYVYYTARRGDDRLCVAVATAALPSGPYTDHGDLVCQPFGSIDAMAVTEDRTGARYLVWKEDGNDRCPTSENPDRKCEPTRNWAQRLSPDGLKLLGEEVELIRNDPNSWEGHVVEGAFILRRGEWFYLFYSGSRCCGRSCDYALGVARSKNLLGPYDKNPANPILKKDDHWQCPGHGSIVTDAQGRDFLLYHAYRNSKTGFFIGREALLAELSWPSDGWPKINVARVSTPPAHASKDLFFDGFGAANLKATWQWPAFKRPYIKLDTDGWLTLSPPRDHEDDELGAVVAQPVTTGRFVATTLVDTSLLKRSSVAGISVYQYHGRAVGISIGRGTVSTYVRDDEKHRPSPCENGFNASRIYLRMTVVDGSEFRFAFSLDGQNWKNCGDEIRFDKIEGARIALTAGGERGGTAKFDWLRVAPL